MSGNRLIEDSDVVQAIREWIAGSWVLAAFASAGDATGMAVEHARFTALVRTLARWTRHAWLYRWLTAEPEPEVIVIDLRETYTVGPIIAALDWLAARVGPRWRASRVRSALRRAEERVEPLLETVAESRVGKLLRALFVPPEPPEDR